MIPPTADFEEIKKKRADLYSIVFSQAFSPCGNYLAACNNFGRIAVFSVSNSLDINAASDSRHPVNSFQADKGSIYSLISTSAFLISGGISQISGWKWKDVIHSRNPRPSWTLHLSASTPFDVPETNSLAYNSQDNTLISGGGDNLVYVWDFETGICKTKLEGHTDYVHCVTALEASNRCASGSEDGSVKLWDSRATKPLISTFEPSKDPSVKRPAIGKWISCLDVDKNEQWMVCGGGPHLSCWHLGSSTLTSVLPTRLSCQLSALFYEDKIFSGGTDSNMYHWSVNGDRIAEVPCSAKSIYSLAVNSNSSRNKVLSVAGESTDIDVCTNFNYQAFSFKFKSVEA